MCKFNKRILAFSLIALFVFITGCSSESNDIATGDEPAPTDLYLARETSEPTPTFFEMSEEEQQAMREEQTAKMIEYGKKIKALSDVPGMDETVITINGYSITRRQYEVSKLTNELNDEIKTEKEVVDSFVRTYAKKTEAERLGLEPLQEDIDGVVETSKEAMESRNEENEMFFAYIEASGISMEEYWTTAEESVYSMFQREELRKYLESEKGITDFEKYYDELVEKADVEILDPDIKKAYKDGSAY